jgi:hypothetical protein
MVRGEMKEHLDSFLQLQLCIVLVLNISIGSCVLSRLSLIEGAIHAPKESFYVEHDYADRFLSHA